MSTGSYKQKPPSWRLTLCFTVFVSVLQQAGRNPSQASLREYWTNTTSKLNFDDFCEILKHEKKTEEAELMRAFRKMDVNGDGYITYSELENTLTTVSNLKAFYLAALLFRL